MPDVIGPNGPVSLDAAAYDYDDLNRRLTAALLVSAPLRYIAVREAILAARIPPGQTGPIGPNFPTINGDPRPAVIGNTYSFIPNISAVAPYSVALTGIGTVLAAGGTFSASTGGIYGPFRVAGTLRDLAMTVTDGAGRSATFGPFSIPVVEGDPDLPPGVSFIFAEAYQNAALANGNYAGTIVGYINVPYDHTAAIAQNSKGLFSIADGKLLLTGTVNYATDYGHDIAISVADAAGSVIVTIPISFSVVSSFSAVRYVSLTGSGDMSGDSLANKAPYTAINSQIIAASLDGGTVKWCDQGDILVPADMRLTNGGTAEKPVLIEACDVDGNFSPTAYPFRLVGDRYAAPGVRWEPPADEEATTDVLTFSNRGSRTFFSLRQNRGIVPNYLTFRGWDVAHARYFIRLAETSVAGISIQDLRAKDFVRVIENDNSNRNMRGWRIERVSGVGFERAFLRSANTNDLLLRDIMLDARRQMGLTTETCGIIQLTNLGSKIRILASNPLVPNIVKNAHGRGADGWYRQGDGIETNYPIDDVLIEDTIVSGCTDRGFDIKGSRITIRRCEARDNTRNFGLWNYSNDYNAYEPYPIGLTLEDIKATNPRVRDGNPGTNNKAINIGMFGSNGVGPDILFKGNNVVTDNNPAAYGILNGSTTSNAILRFTPNSFTFTGQGPMFFDEAGGVFQDKVIIRENVDLSDTTPPSAPPGMSPVIAETSAPYSHQLELPPGTTAHKNANTAESSVFNVSQKGLITLAAGVTDFEALAALGHNPLDTIIDIIDEARNVTSAPYSLTVTDVPGDTGGSVDLGDTYGVGWSKFDKVNATVSGVGRYDATATGVGMVRMDQPTFAALQQPKVTVEMVIGEQPPSDGFGIGISVYGPTKTAAPGSDLKMVVLMRDGRVMMGGEQLLPASANRAINANDTFAIELYQGAWGGLTSVTDGSKIKPEIEASRIRRIRFKRNGIMVPTAEPDNWVTFSERRSGSGLIPNIAEVEVYPTAWFGAAGESVSLHSRVATFTYPPSSGFTEMEPVQQRLVSGAGAAYYVRRGANGDGSSIATPANPSTIGAGVASLSASQGTQPHLFYLVDDGVDVTIPTINIQTGGTSNTNRITLLPVDDNLIPCRPNLEGGRTFWEWPDGAETITYGTGGFASSTPLFALKAGAKNLTFEYWFGSRFTTMFYFVNGADTPADNVTVRKSGFYNNQRGLANWYDGTDPLQIGRGTNQVIEKCYGIGHSKPCLNVRTGGTAADRGPNNYDIEIRYNAIHAAIQSGNDWCGGFEFEAESNNILAHHNWLWRNRDVGVTSGQQIQQGDGIVINAGCRNFRLNHNVIVESRDGCLDIKPVGGDTHDNLLFCSQSNAAYKTWGQGLFSVRDVAVGAVAANGSVPIRVSGSDSGNLAINPSTTLRDFVSVGVAITVRFASARNHFARFIDLRHFEQDPATGALAAPVGLTPANITNSDSWGGLNSGYAIATATDTTPPALTAPLAKITIIGGNTMPSIDITRNESSSLTIQNGTLEYLPGSIGSYVDASGLFRLATYNHTTSVLRPAADGYIYNFNATDLSKNNFTIPIAIKDGNENIGIGNIVIEVTDPNAVPPNPAPSANAGSATHTVKTVSGTSHPFTLPTGLAEGDYVFVVPTFSSEPNVAIANFGSIVFDKLNNQNYDLSGDTGRTVVYYHRVAAGEAAALSGAAGTITTSTGSSSGNQQSVIQTFRISGAANALPGFSSNASSGTSAPKATPVSHPSTNNLLALLLIIHDDSNDTLDTSALVADGFTTIFNDPASPAAGGAAMYSGWKTKTGITFAPPAAAITNAGAATVEETQVLLFVFGPPA